MYKNIEYKSSYTRVFSYSNKKGEKIKKKKKKKGKKKKKKKKKRREIINFPFQNVTKLD